MTIINKYGSYIKGLRKLRTLSQVEVAKKLNISRASYITIEQDKRELTLAEAQKLADLFGITLKDLECGVVPNYEKYKQMILAYLRAGGDHNRKITKTKLAKLIYLADFSWFYKHLESMSGMQYRKIQFGPVPDNYFRALDELYESGKINIEQKDGAMLISETRSAHRDVLTQISANEKKLIKQIADKWKNKRTQEIVEFTHQQLPYLVCHNNEMIPYELITQEDPEYVY